MDPRGIETLLARLTLMVLVVYVPLETYVSWSAEYWLFNPFYIVDLIAMVLLSYGAIRSLRARPEPAPGILCAASGWASANGWRATWDRVFELIDGGALEYGAIELCAVACATGCSLVCFGLSLHLVSRADGARRARSARV